MENELQKNDERGNFLFAEISSLQSHDEVGIRKGIGI